VVEEDINAKNVSIDSKTKKEIKNDKKNSGMNTQEENKHLLSWEKNTTGVMCGYANSLMNMK